MKRWLISVLILACFPALAVEPVTVVTYADIAVYLDRQAAARVESLDEARLSAQVSATVQRIPVRPGQTVAAGELLLELDPADFQIQVNAARARLEGADAALDMARLRVERARRLAPQNFVSEDQLLEAETRYRQAQAEHEGARQELISAELALDRTRIIAPFAAVLTERLIGVGALAAPGTPLLELVAVDELEVVAGISPEMADGLTAAESVHFESGGRSEPVALLRLAPVLTRGGRNRQARLGFVAASLPAGSEGRIRWTDPRPSLPAQFIVQRHGQLGVMLLADDGSAEFLPLPEADAGRPHLLDLPGDTQLIDDGRRRVSPGQRVRIR
ncbi:MAG: efflux RND transporter periplasmic adaptor subunit [Wenzhouxiangella sp.]|nr:efflux RND transporter periplasmic adaptor subunit [Wenzhouxiangella sp.]MCH8478374.1 efflux RND transporter periplasmic adaptor subunit [Wenzhouxiangella sp.]